MPVTDSPRGRDRERGRRLRRVGARGLQYRTRPPGAKGSAARTPRLWEPLVMTVKERGAVVFQWIKGHSGHEVNDLVDKFAVAASLRAE